MTVRAVTRTAGILSQSVKGACLRCSGLA